MKYACEGCGAEGVKLWRLSTVCLGACNPLCLACARKRDPALVEVIVQPDGSSLSPALGLWSDHLYSGEGESRVPAVPSPDGSFWGYTSVPSPDVRWWRSLPLSRQAVDMCNHHMDNAQASGMRGALKSAARAIERAATWRWGDRSRRVNEWVCTARRIANGWKR